MSKEVIYRYECSLCPIHDYAKDLPTGWVEAYVEEENAVDPQTVHFCPDHGKIMTGGVPTLLLNAGIRFNKGVSPSLHLKNGNERYPPVYDRT